MTIYVRGPDFDNFAGSFAYAPDRHQITQVADYLPALLSK
jgi:hypothetical protein